MGVRFLTPPGALLALTALLPLAVYALRRRRLLAIGRALGLTDPTLRSQIPLVLCLAAVPALLGLAAAQPVVETTRTVPERTDVQAFVVVDVSRSMLAAAGPGAATRFERAQRVALEVRSAMPEVPFGIATMTDRVLPNLFPTTDARVFVATLQRAVGIERPPPSYFYYRFATNLNSLRAVPEKNYFPPSVTKRVLLVLTDGETETPDESLARAFEREPKVQTVFAHVWKAEERIYETGVAEGDYAPDARSGGWLARAASLTGGSMYDEGDESGIVEAVRQAVGTGETVPREQQSGRFALMPYVTLAALVPLVVILLRRNLWFAPRLRRRRQAGPEAARAPEDAKVSGARGVAQPG